MSFFRTKDWIQLYSKVMDIISSDDHVSIRLDPDEFYCMTYNGIKIKAEFHQTKDKYVKNNIRYEDIYFRCITVQNHTKQSIDDGRNEYFFLEIFFQKILFRFEPKDKNYLHKVDTRFQCGALLDLFENFGMNIDTVSRNQNDFGGFNKFKLDSVDIFFKEFYLIDPKQIEKKKSKHLDKNKGQLWLPKRRGYKKMINDECNFQKPRPSLT